MISRNAYIAGIIDGEGSIGFRKGKNQTIHLYVSNTHMPLLDWLKNKCGGTICCYIKICLMDCQENHFHKRHRCWRWTVQGERAAIILQNILPYLIIKKQQTEKVLKLWYESAMKLQVPQRRISTAKLIAQEMVKRRWKVTSFENRTR